MSVNSRYIKMLILPILGLTLLLQALIIPSAVYAADGPSITIKTDLGYNGRIKASKWNPVKITLTSDTDVSGDIVIQNTDNYMGSASIVQHVELTKNTAKEVIVGIPGVVYDKNRNQIRFYKDSVKEGKYIPFSSGKSYIEGVPENGAIIGVLSDDPDTMIFMNVLRGGGYDLNIVKMQAAGIPEDPMLLDGLDVLVINRFASDTLSKTQISAISGWVKSGGTMVLAGGAGYPKTAAAFADLSPVQYEGTFSVSSLPELASLGGKPLNLEGDFTLSNAQPLEDSEVLYRAENKPLIVSRQIEQGNVLYAAYDLTMAPISSWNGHPKVWSHLLKNDLPLNNQNRMFPDNQLNNLGYILNYFPSLKMPGFSGLVWMLMIYVVVVAPVLYWILRKVDRREWAWWIIPLIAIIASATVYTVGSSDKTKELAHTLNILELNGRGSSTTTSATAFFTPSSGDYTLEFPKNTHIRLQRESGLLGSSGVDNSFIEVGSQETKVDLLNMPQWSLAKMWAQQTDNRQVGQLNVTLSLNDQGNVEGKVINETTSDLTKVVLVVGAKVYELGDIAKNKQSDILTTTSGKNLNLMGGNIGSLLYPYTNTNNGNNFNRERELLMNYVPYTSWYEKGSYILAWSNDPILTYTHEGKAISSNQLNLWAQPVMIDLIQSGTINIPFGYISPNMTQVNAGMWNQDPNGMINMSQGVATFEYELPKLEKDAVYEELTLRGTNVGQNTEFKIWNEKKLDWEVVVWQSNGYTINTNVEQYAMNGKMLRLTVSAKDQTSFTLPDLRLKGKVKP
ncbi:DUF7408 domain-containing protein [Paenibacillus glacialis]|uniref:Glutamine amidotransferase domain-containing protein n=1 Tax=Paenibacillus glacialis TaxID=494026 RepID=A0A168NW12_9BACL|nr:hypothetical protein [Paenibacillus glacialis]OAB46152.1 hypothetical protein PGLA_01810 [Paenibacillus glacialis]